MEWEWNFFIWSIIILSPALLLLHRRRNSTSRRLPPGPPGWPIFGNLFNLGTLPHRTLAKFKQQYGPIVWIKLASANTMVVLTAKAAEELFKNHDLSFLDRTITVAMRSHDYHKGSLAVAPYGTYWRVLRRICTVEMFVNKKINQTTSIRRKCVNHMLTWIKREENGARGINVGRFVFLASFNMIGNLTLSRDLVDPDSKVASEFYTAVNGLMEWVGSPNISDLFPWLSWFDFQGLKKKMDRDVGKALEIASGYVKERVKEREGGGGVRKNDFLDVLLEFEGNGKDEPAKLTEHQINVFILEMFLAGSETTSSSVEWVLSELLRNPETMMKAKAELANVVGPNRKFEESDIDNLHYLQAAVKETFRLHPPVPLLLPRTATKDTEFMGYHIPKNTQVFVNVWAIGRDPECWDDPLCFKPERFLGSKIEYKGQHFELIPFGGGRRICAGLPLAHRLVHFVLGSLLHEFDWELDSHVNLETMDMTERMGMTARKFESLIAVPKPSTFIKF